MKKRLSTLFIRTSVAILVLFLTLFPLVSSAVDVEPPDDKPGSTDEALGGDGAGEVVNFQNPLKAEDLIDLIGTVLGILLYVAIPIAVLYFLWAAVGLIQEAAKGGASKLQDKKRALWYAFIGLFLLASLTGIMKLVTDFLLDKAEPTGQGIEKTIQKLQDEINKGLIKNE